MTTDLFSPFTLGPLELPNRIVMAPMTRSRAGSDAVPSEHAAAYYSQRAAAGLIITEASQVSERATGYPNTPGIYTKAQVDGWRSVTDAVHAAGGRIFLQLWYVGRVAVQSAIPGNRSPVGPSPIRPAGKTFLGDDYAVPHALSLTEIAEVVQEYVDGARRAKDAGFDGVEIHGANGYLPDQFLRSGSNSRTDAYGGSVENRARLLLEITEGVIGVWGKDRVGVRLSPVSGFNDMSDGDPVTTFAYAARSIGALGAAYLHIVEPVKPAAGAGSPVAPVLREAFRGAIILNSGYDANTASAAIASGAADLISFGTPFIANPDLVRRFAEGAPLSAPDPATIYSGGPGGYSDYPSLA